MPTLDRDERAGLHTRRNIPVRGTQGHLRPVGDLPGSDRAALGNNPVYDLVDVVRGRDRLAYGLGLPFLRFEGPSANLTGMNALNTSLPGRSPQRLNSTDEDSPPPRIAFNSDGDMEPPFFGDGFRTRTSIVCPRVSSSVRERMLASFLVSLEERFRNYDWKH